MICLEVRGSDASVILLVRGILGPSQMNHQLWPLLARSFRVIALKFPSL